MTKDLTQGSPVRLILGFALPLLAGMLFQQLYNLVDTLIVGRFLGMEALAGVGATGSINFLVLGFCMGICSGFAIPVAQQFGAHEESRMREFVSNGTWLSIVFAAVMTVLTVVYCADILRLMNTPEDCFDQAYNYIVVIFAGIPFTFLYNLLSGWLRSLGDSKTPLFFLVLSSVLNVILDLAFILVFKLGVFGASLATVLSPGDFWHALPAVYRGEGADSAYYAGGMAAAVKADDRTVRLWRADGPAIFHYGNRQRDFAGRSQFAWLSVRCGGDGGQ